MLPFHDGPVICENIITKILFASCSAKISYRENFRMYGMQYVQKLNTRVLHTVRVYGMQYARYAVHAEIIHYD